MTNDQQILDKIVCVYIDDDPEILELIGKDGVSVEIKKEYIPMLITYLEPIYQTWFELSKSSSISQ